MADYTVKAVLTATDKNFTANMRSASKVLENLQNTASLTSNKAILASKSIGAAGNNLGGGYAKAINAASNSLKNFQNYAQSISDRSIAIGQTVAGVGASITKGLTFPLTAAFAYAGKKFMEYETGLVGVGKTTGLVGKDLQDFGGEIKSMSNEIPVSTKELLGLAETAGQLGIHGKKDLLAFTRVMAEMGSATNLAGQEGATAMAQFANVMGLDVEKNIRSVGNAIVRLGNNSATTEKDIMDMASRLGASGRLVGLTADNVLGLSAAMASVGINAEAGGSAMSQVLNKIDKAVASGGEKLEMFAKVSGMTSEEFASAWKNEPIKAVEAFMKGLDDSAKAGGNMNLILDALGIKGIREANTVKLLSQNHKLLEKSINDSTDAYKKGNDLAKEAGEAWKTLSNKLKISKNIFSNIFLDVFKRAEPIISKVVDTINKLASKWEKLTETQKNAISGMVLKVGALLAATGPLLTITGKLSQAFGFATGAIGKVSGGLSSLVDKFQGAPSLIRSGMDAVNNKFLEAAEVFPKMSAKATAGIEFMKKVPNQLQTNVAARVYDVFDKMEFDTQQKWTNALTSISNTSSKMGTFVSGAFGKIGGVLNLFGINVGNMVKLANLGLKALFPGAIIGAVLVGLGALYTGFEGEINKVLEVAKEKGPEIIKNLGDKIVEKIPEFASKGVELVSRLAETISANIPTILTVGSNIIIALVESVGNNAGKLIGSAVEIIGSLLQGLVQNLPKLLVAGVRLIAQIVAGIVQNMPRILQIAGDVISGLVTGLGQCLPQLLSSGVKIIFEIIKGIVTNLPQIIATGFKIILALGKAIISAIGTIIGGVGSAIKGFFTSIFSPGKKEAADTNKQVTSETQQMSTNVEGILSGLNQNVASNTSQMQSSVKTSFSDISTDMQANFGQGVDAVTSASQNLTGTVPQGANSVSEQSAAAYEKLAQRTKTAMDGMANSVQSSMAKISSVSTSGLNGLSSGFTNTFNRITSTVNQGVNRIVASINQMNLTVARSYNNFASQFISRTRSMWSQFTSMSQQAMARQALNFVSTLTKMASKYTSFTSQFKNTTNSMWRSAVNQTRQAGNNMTQAYSNACSRIISLANNLRSNLISIMNSTSSGMRGAGYNAGMGFYYGLASTRGAIMGLASSIAYSVTARIRSALSIHSPSRVMMSMGSFAGEGLAIGLEKSKKFVGRAVDGISHTVSSAKLGFDTSFGPSNPSEGAKPMVINLSMGKNEFRAISRDITQEQGRDLRLEANFGL